MARFKLSMKNQHGTTVLTDYDTMRTTGGLTFDEQLNLSTDGSTLSFSMLKYLYEASNKIVNTPAISITYGTVIQLITNDYRYDFAVTSIDYQFLSENLQLSFSTQDLFQFETSRLGVGYTIVADPTDPEYLGAQPIDYWARKIVSDNNLNWTYIGIDNLNQVILTNYNSEQTNRTRAQIEQNKIEDWLNLPKTDYSTLNSSVSFECSDSNAFNALKQLATDNELFIWVDYSGRNFGFVPLKNPIFNGYYFNPNNNLQSFSLRGDGGNLITVLNVTGPKDINDQEITLVPTVPGKVNSYINTDDWESSIYYPGMYIDLVKDDDLTKNSDFIYQIEYTPWFENKLINIDFFTQDNLLTLAEKQDIEYTLYNDLRRANGRMITSWSAYITQYEQDLMDINQNEIAVEGLMASLYADTEAIYEALQNNKLITIAYRANTGDKYASVVIPDGYVIDVTINNTSYYNIPNQPFTPDENIEGPLGPVAITQVNNFGSQSLPNPFLIQTLDNQEIASLYHSRPKLQNNIPQIQNITDLDFGSPYYVLMNRYSNLGFKILGPENSVIGPGGIPVVWNEWKASSVGFSIALYDNNGQSFKVLEIFLRSNGQFNLAPSSINSLATLNDETTDLSAHTAFWLNGYGYFHFDFSLRKITGGFSFNFSNFEIVGGGTQYGHPSVKFMTAFLFLRDEFINIFPLQYEDTLLGTYCWKNGLSKAYIINSDYAPMNFNHQLILQNQQTDTIPYTDVEQLFWGDTPVDSAKYVIIKKGPADIVLKKPSAVEDQSPEIIASYKLDEDLEKNVLQSIYTLQNWTPSLTSKSPNILSDLPGFLNQYCTKYDTYKQLFLENIYKFQNEWNRVIINDPDSYSVGQIYSTYYKIGVINNSDQFVIGDIWSESYSSYYLTNNDIEIWRSILGIKPDPDTDELRTILRNEVIQYCAKLSSTLTQYWSLAYSAAQILGYYLPQNWDCITALERLTDYSDVKQLAWPLLRSRYYNSTTSQWIDGYAAPYWNVEPTLSYRFFINVTSEEVYKHSYKFFDLNDPRNNWTLDTRAQTQLYYDPVYVTDSMFTNTYYQLADNTHQNYYDNIRLYYTTNRSKTNYYTTTNLPLTTEGYLLNYIPSTITLIPLLNQWIQFISNHNQYDLSKYYTALNKHNEIWQSLYTKYPGIFRESSYVNETASSSHELYLAAKRELDKLSKPEFAYTLTGMDIYMHNSDFLPTRIKLGEQIRIDYQEKDQITTTLNTALREPLFITGIQHSLRNDGDYQFTVTTRSATDTMVQRFAKLLNFKR